MSTNILTYDVAPARRPGVSDVGGGAKINGPVAPNPVTKLAAEDINQMSLQIAALARVTPAMIVSITQTAGTYSVAYITAAGSGVVAGSITITKNGTGDVTLSWAAGLLPGAACLPMVTLNDGAGAYRAPEATLPTATSVRVKVQNGAGAAVDASWTVAVY